MANLTSKYGICMRCIWCNLNSNERYTNNENTFIKVDAPPADQLFENPKYAYDFQFSMSEMYATIWLNKRIQFLNDIAKKWQDDAIQKFANEACTPPGDSSDLQDIARCKKLTAEEILKDKALKVRYDKVFLEKVEKVKDERVGQVKVLTDVIFEDSVDELKAGCLSLEKKKEWECTRDFRSNTGPCVIKWQCGISEWEKFCEDEYGGMTFASVVTSDNRFLWILAMVILAASITSDCCEHLMHLRFLAWPHKLLLIGQLEASMMLCLLNGTLTAGSKTVLDILMNAVGLIVLNDLDNIIGAIFVFNSGIDHAHEDEILIRRDRQFGMAFSIPHMIWVLFYSLFFLGIFQGTQPVVVFKTILLVQSISFPIIFISWY